MLTIIEDDICNTDLPFLAHIGNTIAIRSHGLSKTISKKFPFAVEYETRDVLPMTSNLAWVACRPTPGTISVHPHAPTTIIWLWAMYRYGAPNQYMIWGAMDYNDSAENRLLWFRQCLGHLGNYVSTFDDNILPCHGRLDVGSVPVTGQITN